MSTIAEKIAVMVRPPRQGDTYRIGITASSVAYTIPSGYTNKMITMKAIGGDAQIQFGLVGDTLLLVLDEVSTGTPPALVAETDTGITLASGEEISFTIADETQFAIIGAAAAGYVEMYLSSQPYDQPGLT